MNTLIPNSAKVSGRLNSIEKILLPLAKDLLLLQGKEINSEKKSTPIDLVTEADYLCENVLCEHIQNNFPNDTIISEESSSLSAIPHVYDGFCWILDPIDGTASYANRSPSWAVSIGLYFASYACGAIVLAPALQECFRAQKGEGAFLNGKQISINRQASLAEGIIATGFPYCKSEHAKPLAKVVENVLEHGGGFRRMGAAALDFCYVAAGRFAGYYEAFLQPWDSAAGKLIAEEAGARLTDLNGEPFCIFNSKGVIASNGRVHTQILEAAQPLTSL